jgi:hypothetical protein
MGADTLYRWNDVEKGVEKMKKIVLLAVLCLSMMIFATPFSKGTPAKTASIESITIISPQDVVYNTATPPFGLPLEIHIDVPRMAMVAWIGYSLDGDLNETISGNTVVPVGYGHHNITVYGTDVSGGTYASETVDFTVSIPYDVDGDGTVGISDIVAVGAAYGSTPEDLHWNPSVDVTYPYGKIDICDLVSVVFHYGDTL